MLEQTRFIPRILGTPVFSPSRYISRPNKLNNNNSLDWFEFSLAYIPQISRTFLPNMCCSPVTQNNILNWKHWWLTVQSCNSRAEGITTSWKQSLKFHQDLTIRSFHFVADVTLLRNCFCRTCTTPLGEWWWNIQRRWKIPSETGCFWSPILKVQLCAFQTT